MPATVNQVAIRLVKEYGYPSTDTEYVAQVEAWISDSWADLVQAVRWEFTKGTNEDVTTIASTAEYSLSTSVAAVTACRIPSLDQQVYYVTEEELIARGIDFELEGTPEVFYLSGYTASTGKNKVKFWPIPNVVLTIRFTNELMPVILSSSTTLPCPDHFIPVLMDLTRISMSFDDGQLADAAAILNRLEFRLGIRRTRTNTNVAEERERAIQDITQDSLPLPNMGRKYPAVWILLLSLIGKLFKI